MKLYEHPDYIQQSKDWADYKTFFTGEGVNTRFLIPHDFETGTSDVSVKMWSNRLKRTEYTNLVEPFVNRYTAMCFSGENDFSIVEEKLGDTGYNVDGTGLSFEDFLRQKVVKDLILYGKPTIHIDAPEGKKVRPYLKTISPLNIKSWIHENGQLTALRFDYEIINFENLTKKPELKSLSDIYELEENFVVVSTFEKQGGTSEYKFIEEKLIAIDELPFVQVITGTRMKQCAPILRAKHNLESAYDNQLLFQAIQRIIILGENISTNAPVVANEGAITVIKGTGSINTIQPTEPKSLERRIEQRLNDFFKIAFNQTRHMPSDSRAGQSADSMKESKEDFTKQVEATNRDIEYIANQTFRIMCKFQGVDINPEEDKIIFGKNIDPENLQEQILNARVFFQEINQYPTWRKETLKKLARSQNLKDISIIEDEIDKTNINQGINNQNLTNFLNNGR